jgi:ABC-type sulfate transport system substrate-binding protein
MATNRNLLEKGWTKTQPFKKRLDQKTTQIKVRTHNKFNIKFWSNLFLKGCVLVQPFFKRLLKGCF